jgi:Bcr-Abl oncoprotein oligomerisation domain
MNTYGDFRKAWDRKFPGNELPSDWEENVRVNLRKHKQKVRSLEEELSKEKTYVEYLERLLHERHEQNGKSGESTPDDDHQQSRAPLHEDAALKIISELSQTLANIENGAVGEPEKRDTKTIAEPLKTRSMSDVSHYVTVIEVNEGDMRALKKAQSVVEGEKPKKVPPKPPPKTFQLRRDGSDASVNQLLEKKADPEPKAAGLFNIYFISNIKLYTTQ